MQTAFSLCADMGQPCGMALILVKEVIRGMAEENKHPPTTEEQAPPEMPRKAPKMEQAEIPDVGGGPAPSAKVIDLSAMRSTPEKDAPPDIPKETEAPSVSVTEYSKR